MQGLKNGHNLLDTACLLYTSGDDPEHLIKKFVEDFGRLYKDFLLAGTLHDFVRIQLSVDADTAVSYTHLDVYKRQI